MSVSYQKIALNDGWKLGWKRDPRENKWIVGFNTWRWEENALVGRPTSYTRALIYANCKATGDHDVLIRFTLPDEHSDFRPILGYSITRLSGYYLVLRPGQKMSAYYVYSELYDHGVQDEFGPVLEKGREYTLLARRVGTKWTLLLDGEEVGSLDCTDPCGDYAAMAVMSGSCRIHELTISAGDATLFSDDFSQDPLPRDVDVAYPELSCDRWIDAVVPGTVQTALLNAGVIEDPYLPFGGEKSHWMTDQRWIYKKTFRVPDEFRGKRLRLLFHGVDYLAHFFINGKKLCSHEGMFGGPELDVTEYVDWHNENELAVCILPCPNPPHNNVRPYILHRWHFNMDIITAGLWRGVELIADDRMYLTDPQVSTRCIRPDGTAVLDVAVTASTMALWPFDLRGQFILRSPDPDEAPITVDFAPGFCQGSLRIKGTLEVPSAKLWWPNGMGDQPLYQLDVMADLYEYQKQPAPTAHDELHVRTGIRVFKMAPMPPTGSQKLGTLNWHFTVNGRPFFAKGSNWMPMDQMLRLDKEHYRRLLTRARDSHINFLRPWGAGLIETDDFYDLCDELGIMVWQETLFANGIYDGSKMDVWRDTMRRSVCRIRNHPSLAVYCGGNEFDPDLPENKDIIEEITAICDELDPEREFRPASPYGGDNHSYLVNWMGGQPYTSYTQDHSVAITEFSQASPPIMDTLRRMIPEDALAVFPPDLPDPIDRYDYKTWGRDGVKRGESAFSILDAHLSGITNIMFPPLSDAGKPRDMEEFVDYLQTTQGLLTQFGIDVWRSRFPRCTAAMSWVFNVIFPDSMSWSYVDYFGAPKRSYYYQKRAFEPLHVTASFDQLFNPSGSALRIHRAVINEHLCAQENLSVITRLYDCHLALLASDTKKISVQADDVRNLSSFRYDIPQDMPDQVLFLCVELRDESGKLLSRSHYCPRVGTPQVRMPYLAEGPWISDVKKASTTLEASAIYGPDEVKVTVRNTGDLPAFQVYLHAPQMDHVLRYSDNCFWLDAGESKEIVIQSFEAFPEVIEVSAWNVEKRTVGIE